MTDIDMNEIEVINSNAGGIEARCPKCNKVIFDMESYTEDLACKHVLMVYAGCCNEVTFCPDEMDKVVEEMEAKIKDGEEKDEDIAMTDLMQDYANENGYKVYTITTSGMACGPVSYTDYFMIGTIKPKVSKKVKASKKAKNSKKSKK